MHRKIFPLILSLSLMTSAPAFAAERPSSEKPGFFAMTGDLIVARPLLLVTTIVGGALFIVSSPFSALGGNLDEAADVLVKNPAKATFSRCLGCAFSEDE